MRVPQALIDEVNPPPEPNPPTNYEDDQAGEGNAALCLGYVCGGQTMPARHSKRHHKPCFACFVRRMRLEGLPGMIAEIAEPLLVYSAG
jgi:hypothetical protein